LNQNTAVVASENFYIEKNCWLCFLRKIL